MDIVKPSKLLLLFIIQLQVILYSLQLNAQCLEKHQLTRMQSAKIDDIRGFLNAEGWDLNDMKSNQTYNYFDYPLSFDMLSWTNSRYYYNGNIVIYTAPKKPNIVIYQTTSDCFHNLLRDFNLSKGSTQIDEDILKTIFKENSLTIEFREDNNDNSSKQYSVLVYNTTALTNELKSIRDQELKLQKEIEAKERLLESIIAEGDILFKSGRFEDAKVKLQLAIQIKESVDIQQKIQACTDAICGRITQSADSLFALNQFQLALEMYKKAKTCSPAENEIKTKIIATEKAICSDMIRTADSFFTAKIYESALAIFKKAKVLAKNDVTIDMKIVETEKTILNIQIEKLFTSAGLSFNRGDYSLTIQNYKDVLKLDPNNKKAQEEIHTIEEILSILQKRSTTVFTYSKTNYSDFLLFKRSILKYSNNLIDENAKGFINLNYLVSFDTFGNNLSDFMTLTSSAQNFEKQLKSLNLHTTLKPAVQKEFYLASRESISLDIKWNTESTKFLSKYKGIVHNNQETNTPNAIKNYIKSQPLGNGKFYFNTKNIVVNGVTFSNIDLVKYKIAGPSAAFYSMLLPGLGTLRVTYGEKGKGRIQSFLLTAGLAVGAKLFSNAQYNSYLTATNQNNINSHYQNATLGHQIALISAGVSASIYVYDIFWVISKGVKNRKQSQQLRKTLKKGPISIVNQKIVW